MNGGRALATLDARDARIAAFDRDAKELKDKWHRWYEEKTQRARELEAEVERLTHINEDAQIRLDDRRKRLNRALDTDIALRAEVERLKTRDPYRPLPPSKPCLCCDEGIDEAPCTCTDYTHALRMEGQRDALRATLAKAEEIAMRATKRATAFELQLAKAEEHLKLIRLDHGTECDCDACLALAALRGEEGKT